MIFDNVSWSETFVLVGVSIALVGRRDLPTVSRFLGTQVGRVVGLLQGARIRADKFTANNELRVLQNELRAGLRELDMVKSELIVAASTSSPHGRLISGVGGLKRAQKVAMPIQQQAAKAAQGVGGGQPFHGDKAPAIIPLGPDLSATDLLSKESKIDQRKIWSSPTFSPSHFMLAPRSQSVAAVAEEVWEKQGIGFKSRAETGTGASYSSSTNGSITSALEGGSSILASLIQQSLIHDQYDRAVKEQDDALRSRVSDRVTSRHQNRHKQ